MRHPVIVATAGLALVVVACAPGTTAEPDPTVVTRPPVVVAQSNPGGGEPGPALSGILVSGVGTATGAPDTVSVDFGVSVRGKTVDEAAARAAERADALISALTADAVERGDIATTNYSIYPEYDYRSGRERLVGYRVTNTVRVTIRDLERAGDIVDTAVAAAGDDARVSGLRFELEDDTDLAAQAREAAWNDALTKATQLAALSGVTLGPVISVVETTPRSPSPIFSVERDAAAQSLAVPTPIEPGTSTVTVALQVHFALED